MNVNDLLIVRLIRRSSYCYILQESRTADRSWSHKANKTFIFMVYMMHPSTMYTASSVSSLSSFNLVCTTELQRWRGLFVRARPASAGRASFLRVKESSLLMPLMQRHHPRWVPESLEARIYQDVWKRLKFVRSGIEEHLDPVSWARGYKAGDLYYVVTKSHTI